MSSSPRRPAHLIWEPPAFETHEFAPKRTRYCFITVVWNEGERLKQQLVRMQERAALADIIVADGRSTDGSTAPDLLRRRGVRTLLITDERGLSTATRMALAYAIEEGYEGVITVDGNGKDGVEAVTDFIAALDEGYDLIQGSRYLQGGVHANTPLDRYLGTRLVMSPCISLGARHFFSDPTNAFRACSRRYLVDPGLQPIRKEFVRFNLQLYLTCRANRLGYRVTEIPVRRCYPAGASVPTKICSVWTKCLNVWEMLLVAAGFYSPRR
jgi:dolichol-phosphate mannosyltransferase